MFRPIMMGMLVTAQRRGLIEVFPEAVRKIWKTGQLRFLIISSLSMQILLIWLGKSRKYNGKPILRCTIWLAYLLADWVATVALGVISNSIQARPNETAPLGDDLMSFWAPFLLLHLGGPDTITAYSLEDNQLWRRRVLELVTQTVLAVYIFLIAWPGIGMIRFRDTCAEFREFFKERRGESEKPDTEKACKMLLRVNTEVAPGKVKGDRSKSVLFDACRLATRLRSENQTEGWVIISQVWVEILAYAACHCRGTHHAQQLRKGGEFLTHVWLLMAHLGISEQFQISQGHARAKFRLK